jgi:hypothetical protein
MKTSRGRAGGRTTRLPSSKLRNLPRAFVHVERQVGAEELVEVEVCVPLLAECWGEDRGQHRALVCLPLCFTLHLPINSIVSGSPGVRVCVCMCVCGASWLSSVLASRFRVALQCCHYISQ